MIYPTKIKVSNLSELIKQYPAAKIKEITANFNLLFLKDNQSAVITETNKYYLITHK